MKRIIGWWITLIVSAAAGTLQFDQPNQEIHAPTDVNTLTAEYTFTNKSSKPVTIAKSDPGCSCVAVQVAEGKLRYDAGESGTLRATFDMGNFSGTVEKAIALWLDEDPADAPSVMLTLKVHIPVLVATEPKTVRWDLEGDASPKTIRITMLEGQNIKIKQAKTSSESFALDLKTLSEGKSYELTVTPRSSKEAGIAVIQLITDSSIKKYETQQVFAVVSKPQPQAAVAKP